MVHINRCGSTCQNFLSNHEAVVSYMDEMRQQLSTELLLEQTSSQPPPPPPRATPASLMPRDPYQDYVYEYHPNTPIIHGTTESFMDCFNASDCQQESNQYYPFRDETEWKLSRFLVCSLLTQMEIDQCLKLGAICPPLFFSSSYC